MFIDEAGNRVKIVLEDGSELNTDLKVADIRIEGTSGKIFSSGPFDYVMIKGFNADRDQELLRQVLDIQMELLRKLKRVCDENGLKLFMMYGTLLGAVRHGGIIPGDDDIDVALLREDYDKLMNLADQFKGKYFLQTPDSDSGFFGGYSKLRNRETTAINSQNQWADCCEGIGIDIFPIDSGFSWAILEYIKEKRICFYQRMLYAKAYGDARNYLDMPLLVWKGYKYLGKLFSKERLNTGIKNAFMSGDGNSDSPMGIYAHYTKGKKSMKFSPKIFENEVMMKYEDLELLAPGGYKNILRAKYGAEFMKLPIPSEEPRHRHGFYDVEHPYTDYKKHFDSRFSKLPKEKEIILIGDPLICFEYIKRHSGAYPAGCMIVYRTVNADLHKYEAQDYGIQQKPLHELKEMDFKKVFPFLCGFDYRKLWRLMRETGCEDYFFFHYDTTWMLTSDPEKEAYKYVNLQGERQEYREMRTQ